jgi:hypothetical protein
MCLRDRILLVTARVVTLIIYLVVITGPFVAAYLGLIAD